MSEPVALSTLAGQAGIDADYLSEKEEPRTVPPSTLKKLLAIMGEPADTPEEIDSARRHLTEASWMRTLPPVLVMRLAEQPALSIPIVVAQGAKDRRLRFELREENGRVASGELSFEELKEQDRQIVNGQLLERRRWHLPVVSAIGYHRLTLWVAGARHEMMLIAAPERCFLPPHLDTGPGDWGFSVQLYALRSNRNWGIGDFTDLKTLAEGIAGLGANAIGLNPIHALSLTYPNDASPYSPSSRLALNALYIDVEACPGAEAITADQAILDPLRRAPQVDYGTVAKVKLAALRQAYARFSDSADPALSEEFSRFRNDGGEALAQWSLFEALKTKFDGKAWFDWPAPFRNRHSAEVAAFAHEHDDELGFHDFLQWQASKQLAAASARCRELGMTVGLYHDLALGVIRDGAEAWANPSLFVGDVSIGAPPDLYNSRGQDWGLVPMNPAVLRSLAYQPFVAMLRTAMRHGGALRIDHVMMLQRLFWIPQGMEPGEGAYLRQPLEDLIGVVALESQRNRCIVVGEDLGTVAAGFRERMSEAGILSYRLLYFQHDKKLRYLPPRDYPKLSMVTVGTHDLPTLRAFWSGADIALRQKLGHIDARGARLAAAEREEQRHNLAAILQQCGLLLGPVANGHLTQDLALAIHAFLARSPGRLMMARFEDLLDVIEQTNVPGTSMEHPNWRAKLPLSTDALASDTRVVRLARLLRRLRPPRKTE